MNYSIQKLKEKINYYERNKIKTLQGYSFHNENGLCMFITWGESRRDYMIKTLFND